MTSVEVLKEIQKLPLDQARKVADQLNDYLSKSGPIAIEANDPEKREVEFEQYLLSNGIASHIASSDETDEEFESFELIEVEGEPLSETIIQERR